MNVSSMDTPTVSIVTSHGRQPLDGNPDDRVFDVLTRHNVPWSAVAAYLVPRSGGEAVLTPSLDVRLRDLEDASEVLLYFNRNVNPFLFALSDFKVVPSDGSGPEATEYFYQQLDNERGTATSYLKKLSPEECRQVIADRVAETVTATLPRGAELVVGVSGGGDSNALLSGLTQTDHDLVIHPIIVKGIADWDAGVPRAEELCANYGLDLKIMEEGDVKDLLGMPRDSMDLIDRFEREFTGDDFEFLGTLLIRLALSRAAATLGTPYICTGLNLEDVVTENLFRISTGMKPASVPARQIGDTTLVMPLWLCPKRIIDGCFPRFSRENYDARYPCFSLGRNLYYSIVYSMQSQYPGFLEQFARGLSELAEVDPVTYSLDQDLGFHVERFVPFPLRRKFERMLGGPITTAS
jgi:tRNA(Ile)-lysidine synthase TilS/MesJ